MRYRIGVLFVLAAMSEMLIAQTMKNEIPSDDLEFKTTCIIQGKKRSLTVSSGEEVSSPVTFRLLNEQNRELSKITYSPSTPVGEGVVNFLYESRFEFKCLAVPNGYFAEYCSQSSSGECGRMEIKIRNSKMVFGPIVHSFPEAIALREAEAASKKFEYERAIKILEGDFLRKYSGEIAEQSLGISKALLSSVDLKENADALNRLHLAQRAIVLYFSYYANGNTSEKPWPSALRTGNDVAFYEYKMKDHSNAEALLKKVLEVDPNRAVAWLNLGDVLAAQNKMSEAHAAYLRHESLKQSGPGKSR